MTIMQAWPTALAIGAMVVTVLVRHGTSTPDSSVAQTQWIGASIQRDDWTQTQRFIAGLPMDLNRVTADDLEHIDGIGPVLAERIIEYRDKHNGFKALEELLNVSGIGIARLESLRKVLVLGGHKNPQ